MLSSRIAARQVSWMSARGLSTTTKPRMTLREYREEPFPPGYTLESVKPPKSWRAPEGEVEEDPMAYHRNPVTSAHAIRNGKVSARDSAALSPSGTVVHGRYGDLGPEIAQLIPLEYLALLRPAAQGAAALRVILEKSKPTGTGTLLVYGASQPAALSAVQLAAAEGHAVVAVVGGEHSGSDEFLEVVKELAREPGTAVTEEYALVKKNFAELVDATMNGEDISALETDTYLKDFKENLLAYAAAYPETRPAAVDSSKLKFFGKEKDRDTFRDNIDAYLHQFPAGSPPFDPARLDARFPKEQYAIFKGKFNIQTTAVITGDPAGAQFDPPHLVHSLIDSPENLPTYSEDIEYVPYEFSILKTDKGIPPPKGGPLLGAVINVTPGLQVAADAVHKAGTSLRAKAEALQFLNETQRNAFAAAMSVANIATKHGAPIYVVGGSLPGLETVEPTDDDVQEALAAMEVDERGDSRLNYYIQVYRAGDFPIYADYAVHRASEALAGPRQFVVTK